MRHRLATRADLPALKTLVAESARGLSAGFYTPQQVESLVRYAFGVDDALIADRTYYVIERGGILAAGGGWSRRRSMHGGEHGLHGADDLINPATEPARIRAFFVHPDFARRGFGRLLLSRSIGAARRAGFRRMALVATLPGEPLYRAFGFEVTGRSQLRLPDGVEVEVAAMEMAISGPAARAPLSGRSPALRRSPRAGRP